MTPVYEPTAMGKKIAKYVKYSLLGLFTLFTLLGSYSTIEPGYRGVYLIMSKAREDVLTEGFHFKIPFFSSIKKISIRVQKSQDKAEAASKDMQKVSAVVALNWHVNPDTVVNLYRKVGDETDINEKIIAPAVSEVLKASAAKFTAEEVLTHRLELKKNIDEMLITRLTTYGVFVDDISLVDLDFTAQFNHAVEEKQVMEQEAKKAIYAAQRAEAQAKEAVNKAKGIAESNLIQAKAQAESQKLLQYTLTKEVLTMEYLKKWDGGLPQVLGNSSGMLFNLDLSKMKGKNE